MSDTCAHSWSCERPHSCDRPGPCVKCGTPRPDPVVATLRDIAANFIPDAALAAEQMALAGRVEASLRGEDAAPKPGRRARVEVKGFRDLGVVRVTETTLAGEPMLHAERDDGISADFPPSSLHFITWLPEGALETTRAMLPPGRGGFDPEYELDPAGLDDEHDLDDTERNPF